MNRKIAVIGLGYVGLPLAVEFGKRNPTLGFDINKKRVEELRSGIDHTLETTSEDLKEAANLKYSFDKNDLGNSDFYIVTVPTPIDKFNKPDLTPLEKASHMIGGFLKKGDVVVYESTVYPGATEEVCVPILENESGLKFNHDFFTGYSPERINPGDKEHTVTKIKKVVSGSNRETLDLVDNVYKTIINAGTHRASSIRVAEAAKVIENTQRDVNIALINELSRLFNTLGIDTYEVLEAAGTKWNFLPFRPGLVGGHCIGVDPYYLTYKAEEVGYKPEIILAGRRMNDGMGQYVVKEAIKLMLNKNVEMVDANALVLGITFKENCPDIRNTRVVDIIAELKEFHLNVDIFDPWADPDEVMREYNITLLKELPQKKYQLIILAVAHDEFKNLAIEPLKDNKSVVYDVKNILPEKDGNL